MYIGPVYGQDTRTRWGMVPAAKDPGGRWLGDRDPVKDRSGLAPAGGGLVGLPLRFDIQSGLVAFSMFCKTSL